MKEQIQEKNRQKDESGSEVSRRKFLKMLGVGAGGLALSSTVSALEWSVLQPSSQGVRDVKSSSVANGSIDSSKIVDSSIPFSDLNYSPIIDEGDLTGGANIDTGGGSIDVSPQGSGSGLDADSVDGQDASQLGGFSLSAFQTYQTSTDFYLDTATRLQVAGLNLDPNRYMANAEWNADKAGISYKTIDYLTSGGAVTQLTLSMQASSNQLYTVTLKVFGITYNA